MPKDKDPQSRLIKTLVLLAATLSVWLMTIGPAAATPHGLSPGNGAQLNVNAQAFSWLDNLDYGPIDHWYLEISTDPTTDYYNWGYFANPTVYSSGRLTSASLNLNSVGRDLPPGTYYWHVVGYYGPWGGNGTAWSLPVQSFTVYAPTPAPIIDVTPGSLTWTVGQGGANPPSQSLYVANKGGGVLNFSFVKGSGTPWLNNPTLGTLTGQLAEIVVSVNIAGKTPGTYNGQIGVWENGKYPSTLVLTPITLRVLPSDSSAPTGSLKINNGGAGTNKTAVTLNVSAADTGSGLDKMRFRNGSDIWSNWYNYATAKAWNLPAANGTRKVWAQFKDKVGNASGVSWDNIILDTVKPTAKVMSPNYASDVSRSPKFKIKWKGSDRSPSLGIASYDVQYRIIGKSWKRLRTGTTKKAGYVKGKAGNTYQFRVRANDKAGNVGKWSSNDKTVVPYDQGVMRYRGRWSGLTRAKRLYKRKSKYSTTRGARATYKFKRARQVTLIVSKNRNSGRAKVYIRGRLVKKISLYSRKTKYRQAISVKRYSRPKSGTLKVVVQGTKSSRSRGFRIEIDGVGIRR